MGDITFSSSKLGTKEYWDSTYKKELTNYQETKDIGEVWFGHNCVSRIVTWLKSNTLVDFTGSILDIGCGNGFLLLELASQGYKDLKGIDYSEDAINLAKSIAKDEKHDIKYEVVDVLTPHLSPSNHYDVCLDKGTFDAISLSPSETEVKKEIYVQNVHSFLKVGGIFILASCNWTEDEVKEQFKKGFLLLERIPTPTFTFGGVQGNRETILVLQKT
ncbi:hypothetical protein LSH36_332g01040 [Paralvinella palmiformis]|uniref:Protein-lysine N-methyltransferase LSH36_332g01040 n=1 Tax=Paralvinella palmiformis TaxID=53620 RepID=A0AAD9JGL4_9ANNE|nr:hypothetical protein LSH36_332g01040 [Paralvinella palmiformis]